ncbi:MAG: leucine-rich repeat domain-containing protein [Clostridia bacterium]|nr:leucine-rich repeat domain-containing protein [Clostridia bacterium]
MNKKLFILLIVLTMICAILLAVGCDNHNEKAPGGDNTLPSGGQDDNLSGGDGAQQEHVHTYAVEWSSDKDFHWHAATCGHDLTADKSAHTFDENSMCVICKYYSSNGFLFELNQDNASYTVKGLEMDNDNTQIVIPSTYQGKPVTGIDNYAFRHCSDLISVSIPSSIESIGSYAFDGCNALKAVYITDISSWCKINFKGSFSNPLEYAQKLYLNNKLVTDLTIPAEITKFDIYAFYNCVDLSSITVDPNNAVYRSQDNCLIEKQTDRLVLGCKNSVIPEYVKSIGSSAFEGCRELTSIEIPSGVSFIGFYAFAGCENLTKIVIPSGVKIICDGVFKNCSSLESVNIPSGVMEIGMSAFSGCASLKNVEIPAGITDIGQGAFASCVNLTKIVIPVGVTNIGALAFVNCPKLTIYCELSGMQSGWKETWNGNCEVVFDYIRD